MFRVLGFAAAIDENSAIAAGVEVFPIPASERVTITSSAAVIRNYVIYDGQGRMVRNGNVNMDRVVLERESMKAGNYYVELFFDEGSLTRKVILD
ncbi:MAG: T9SS type A sorting domain-containing protein [Flavobacteriales bacterium]|nr:T9SS type A sorting domain-containing protein [Flavobacteriales bacterium]